jgi:hypothetical protein
MKKITYLLAIATLAFTACQKQPIGTLYKAPVVVVAPPPSDTAITLSASDYALLPSSVYSSKTQTFDNATDAQNYIPAILNAKFATASNGSNALVTYTQSALYFKQAGDSLSTSVAYTLTHDDYLALKSNTFGDLDFSLAQMLSFMNEDTSVYQTSVKSQLALVTFTPFPSALTPPPPYSYVKLAPKKWIQAYTIQPAQYASVGLGTHNQFTSSNDANLSLMLSALLKADLTIQDTIKAGDIKYISYAYFGSDSKAYQKVRPLQYDGNNYVAPKTSTASLNFVKQSGSWGFAAPLPSINYALTPADITLISSNSAYPGAGNLGQYKDFDSAWSIVYMNEAIIQCLLVDFPTPQTNTLYKVTFNNYSSPAPNPSSFIWDGTKWVPQQQ